MGYLTKPKLVVPYLSVVEEREDGADLRAGKVWQVDAGQLLAVAEVADEGGLEEGGAGGGQDHLVRTDAVGGRVIAASTGLFIRSATRKC